MTARPPNSTRDSNRTLAGGRSASKNARARFSSSDHASVRHPHGYELRRRAGEETFVRDKHVVPRDVDLADLEAEFEWPPTRANQIRSQQQRQRGWKTGQAIEPFDRRMQQLGVGRDGLGLHRGVDAIPNRA